MNSDWLPLGSIEPIEVFAVDATGSPITGMVNLYAAVRRASDGRWLDFNDMTFKAAGWVARQHVMVEFDPVLSAGFYRFTFNTSTFFSADDYVITIEQVPPTVFPRVVVAELRVGGVPDDCTAARKKLINDEVLTPGSVNNWTTLDDDGITPLFQHSVTGPSGEDVIIPAGTPARRTRTL